MWITNGRFAGLFAFMPKHQKVSQGSTDCYVDGLTIGKDEDKMGKCLLTKSS